MKILLRISLLLVFLQIFSSAQAQILHTESFTVILDSTRRMKGSIVPDFNYKNLRKDLFSFENTADLSAKIGKNALTVANKVELSKFGDETLVSGGYIYAEYRNVMEKKQSIELYSQVHWAEARGMERKYAFGVNSRWRIVNRPTLGFFVGIGPFYEFERWNFDGVANAEAIVDTTPIETENIKLGSYASLKYAPFDKIFLDISIYYQSRFDELVSTPRFASSSRFTYQFSKIVGLSLIYQNIYDPTPTVPIDKLYNNIISGFTITF
ncbi:Protein of unknown function, DUF481 [Ekhidna lutea]|uniref:Salt-induced outer membrane protein n=1 Tax=Ekhidna lutea TaxID=447679 RepID=A0A239GSB9_EKHLU|nr:DUF481 domain-containing protein [Ekhidna lutea]SNS71742.1 Protein of unknown function, DUF481 [Ekhidna lutea]